MDFADLFMYGFYALLAVVVIYASYRLGLKGREDPSDSTIDYLGVPVPPSPTAMKLED